MQPVNIIFAGMVQFTTTIKQFGKQGEKTGWTYIEVPSDIAEKLMPGNRKGFRVKGKLDSFSIKGIALIPMGGGNFILTLNADLRRGIHKKKGAMLNVKLQVDPEGYKLNEDFIACLNDDPDAKKFFDSLYRLPSQLFQQMDRLCQNGADKDQTNCNGCKCTFKKMGLS